jgi:plasmid maintenance system antidote protein VapI
MHRTPSKVSPVCPADLRAAIAQSGVHGYIIGARARIHPITLSRILHGHVRITDDLASRILRAIEQETSASSRERSG